MIPSDSSLSGPLKLYVHELCSPESRLPVSMGWVCAPWGAWGVGALTQPSEPHPMVLGAQLRIAAPGRDGGRDLGLHTLELGLINHLICDPE